jgi:hypothetical protein
MADYAAVDVSFEWSSVCVVAGQIVREAKGQNEREARAALSAGSGVRFARIGLEADARTGRSGARRDCAVLRRPQRRTAPTRGKGKRFRDYLGSLALTSWQVAAHWLAAVSSWLALASAALARLCAVATWLSRVDTRLSRLSTCSGDTQALSISRAAAPTRPTFRVLAFDMVSSL